MQAVPKTGFWAYLQTQFHGSFWFNKASGIVQVDTPPDVLVGAQAAPDGFLPNVGEKAWGRD